MQAGRSLGNKGSLSWASSAAQWGARSLGVGAPHPLAVRLPAGSLLELLWPCGDSLVPPPRPGQGGQPSSILQEATGPRARGCGSVGPGGPRGHHMRRPPVLPSAAPSCVLVRMACRSQAVFPIMRQLPRGPGQDESEKVPRRPRQHHGLLYGPILASSGLYAAPYPCALPSAMPGSVQEPHGLRWLTVCGRGLGLTIS